MIAIVARNAAEVFGVESTFVVTDDESIVEAAATVDVRSLMTAKQFNTGTDRLASVAAQFEESERIFNIQGDEPALKPDEIDDFVRMTLSSDAPVTNAFSRSESHERANSPNSIKVVTDAANSLVYASRLPIPYAKNLANAEYKLQVCMYGFSPMSLLAFGQAASSPSDMERRENIEILRFIEMGLNVTMLETKSESHPVDIPQDLEIVTGILGKREQSESE